MSGISWKNPHVFNYARLRFGSSVQTEDVSTVLASKSTILTVWRTPCGRPVRFLLLKGSAAG
jgi:hypothetical protein